jgi:hypothetical protein
MRISTDRVFYSAQKQCESFSAWHSHSHHGDTDPEGGRAVNPMTSVCTLVGTPQCAELSPRELAPSDCQDVYNEKKVLVMSNGQTSSDLHQVPMTW